MEDRKNSDWRQNFAAQTFRTSKALRVEGFVRMETSNLILRVSLCVRHAHIM